ncbi:hypothetical protein Tco_0680149 [Tanacetum coccineum]|uniref:Uncharacterized protein n=1 Tax=Tanacetum coccineum TaxID=301880 RepID=A0ABQ4XKL2_9ASTR
MQKGLKTARNSAIFIAKTGQRLLWVVLAVPDISGGRPAYQGAAPRFEEGGEVCGFDSNEDEVVPKVDEVSLVDGVFDGAIAGDGDDDFVRGEGVVV